MVFMVIMYYKVPALLYIIVYIMRKGKVISIAVVGSTYTRFLLFVSLYHVISLELYHYSASLQTRDMGQQLTISPLDMMFNCCITRRHLIRASGVRNAYSSGPRYISADTDYNKVQYIDLMYMAIVVE